MSTSTILPVIHPIEGNLHAESLAELHTAVVDASRGVEQMREDADADLAPILDAFAAAHERHNRELANEMASHGHPPDDEGLFHSLLSGGYQRLRDMFDDSTTDRLHHLLDNERHVLEAYNNALEKGGPSDTIDLLQRQREELGNLVIKHDPRISEE